MQSAPLLSLLIWVPIVAGIIVLRAGSGSPGRARWLALIGALAGLLPVIPLVAGFQNGVPAMQFVENVKWLPSFDIAWHLGVDGISLWLIVLTALTTLVIVIAGWESITVRSAQYFGSFLMLSGFMQGVFSSLDGMLFFVFFEATLIPLYLLIGTWGNKNRTYAAVKFFFFSLVGSLMMLISMLYLYAQTHSFDLEIWRSAQLGFVPQMLVFLGFLAAFSVKVPMWPVHTWLPDVHLDGPTGAAVMLGMLKIGGYGLLRFALPITPQAAHFFAPAMITLSLVAVIYSSLLALVQTDIRKLLAYSSVSHMGLVTLGLFIFNPLGQEGAIMQMISYGLVSGALLLCTGMLHDRTQTGSIAAFGGVANTMPKFAVFVMLFSMANVGLPGTAGFVGEFMVLMGAVGFNFWIGALAALTLILSACYTLWMYKRVIFGAIANARVAKLSDVSKREFLLLGAMAVLVLAIGIYPKPFTDAINPSSTSLLAQTNRTAQPVEAASVENGERLQARAAVNATHAPG
ncbi:MULTISPECIES: complex I subunit 4 family protein [Paraburkholderia]|jgi:NADH-quinone oxidoreductase subunit M|uniref:NADH dehydrogenase subunit M n=1 Tax=Paraburkholderia phenazinium TaxID=60549 RepID=A0A1N6GFD6_9BURK|nr:NADH-quinone oxidoreductase subunit M [Paraburkholderia phenazinium]SIO06233.1 NADH dehydrogenase subunit M [Paraburkholderia phenazinium]